MSRPDWINQTTITVSQKTRNGTDYILREFTMKHSSFKKSCIVKVWIHILSIIAMLICLFLHQHHEGLIIYDILKEITDCVPEHDVEDEP